jgi:colanic acid biosynthesis glycosyl transferase WcaI
MSEPVQGKPRPRLLVLNQYYGPAESTGQLLRELCEDLAGEIDVTVVAARPSDAESKAMDPGRVDLRWAPATAFAKRSILLRLLNYLTFLVAALPVVMRAPKPDVVLCMTNPPFVGLLGSMVARLRRARLVVTVQDVHPDVGQISGRVTAKPAVWGLAWVRRHLFRRSDRIVAISEAMGDRLVERGAEPGKVKVIPNWIDPDEITPHPRDNPWARENGLVGRFTFMHAGNVGLLQDIESFVDTAALVRDASFVIVGEGANKDALVERARAAGSENVIFLPRQPREQLNLLLASADAHMVSLMPGLGGLMEPSKLYGILAAARPVLASMEPRTEAAKAIESAACGVLAPPGDLDSLAAAARRLLETPATELERMGRRGREYCERHCSRSNSTGSYRELVISLAATNGA